MGKSKFCLFKSDYWNEKCVRVDIFVPADAYVDSNKDTIEQELARLLGEELLKKNLLCSSDSWKPDSYGDVRVYCQANVLELKDREGKMPARLKEVRNSFKKGD